MAEANGPTVQVSLFQRALQKVKSKRINYLARLNPILTTIFPVAFLYSQNIDEVPLMTAVAVLLAALLGSLVFVSVVWLVLRNDAAASFLAVAWLVVFFSHGHILDSITGATVGGVVLGRVRYLLAVEVVIALIALVVALRARNFCYQSTPYISVALLIPFLFTWASVGLYHLRPPDSEIAGDNGFQSITIPKIQRDQLPDIYYIILDSYPRADVLQRIYGFDNGQFLGSLEDKGFFIASESRSNYTQTSLSLSSSLNMDYLNQFPEIIRSIDSNDETILRKLIQDNRVVPVVQEMGYRFAFLHSPWGLTMVNPHADDELSTQAYPLGTVGRLLLQPVLGNDFGYFFSRTILLRHFVDRLFNLFAVDLFGEHLEQLKRIGSLEEPTFTFAHFVPPHPPYVFDREGNVRSSGFSIRSYGDKDAYIDQLIWVNTSINRVVDQILQDKEANAVIVIQGDHGTEFSDTRGILSYGGDPDETLIFEKTGILNAYYLPEMCQPAGLYNSITPVNTFRLIFDRCLGTDIGLLEDVLHWSTYDRPYDFTFIEGVVR